MKKNNYLIIMFGKNESINIDNAIYMSKLRSNFIYIDSSSSDGTQDLLKKNKIKFINHTYKNWKELRQEGYSYAKENNFKWILMLDADEIVNNKTLDYLDKLDKKNYDSYSINFNMIFCGKKLNYLSHRPRIRFYSVDRTYPKGDTILDFIDSKRNKELPKKYSILNNDKKDYISLIKKQVEKVDHSLVEIHRDINEHSKFKKLVLRVLGRNLILKSIFYFSYHYIFKLGFLDGKAGLYYCFNYAFIFHFLMSSKKNLTHDA